jgi:hypothetical protein
MNAKTLTLRGDVVVADKVVALWSAAAVPFGQQIVAAE